MQGQVGLNQEVGDAQVLAALQQAGAGLFDVTPLGRLGRLHGVAHHALGAPLGITFQLQEIGIKVDVRVADYSAIEPDMMAGNFDMALLSRGYATDVAEPAGFLNADYTCGGSYNISHYCNAETDKLIKSAYSAGEPTKRYAIYGEAAKKIYDEAVSVFLIHETVFDAYSAKLENYKPHPLNYFVMTKDLATK